MNRIRDYTDKARLRGLREFLAKFNYLGLLQQVCSITFLLSNSGKIKLEKAA